jgi:hypothetical protein
MWFMIGWVSMLAAALIVGQIGSVVFRIFAARDDQPRQ